MTDLFKEEIFRGAKTPPKVRNGILTSFMNNQWLRQDIMDKITKYPERCRIEAYEDERTGMVGARFLFPTEWIADFDD